MKLATQISKVEAQYPELINEIGESILPLVVKHLGREAVSVGVPDALIHLLRSNIITNIQLEIKICPALLALAQTESTEDISQTILVSI